MRFSACSLLGSTCRIPRSNSSLPSKVRKRTGFPASSARACDVPSTILSSAAPLAELKSSAPVFPSRRNVYLRLASPDIQDESSAMRGKIAHQQEAVSYFHVRGEVFRRKFAQLQAAYGNGAFSAKIGQTFGRAGEEGNLPPAGLSNPQQSRRIFDVQRLGV